MAGIGKGGWSSVPTHPARKSACKPAGIYRAAGTLMAFALSAACLGDPENGVSDPNAIPLALLLSYTGSSASNSINSERAVRLAVERINQAGGLSGRPLRLVLRDIQSDGNRTDRLFSQLVNEKTAAFIGPDSPNVVTRFVETHRQRTLFLPSVATSARDSFFGAYNWFAFGPNSRTLGCAFRWRLARDSVKRPLILHSSDSFHTEVALLLKRALDAPDRTIAIPSYAGLSAAVIEEVLRRDADGLLLMAFPESAAPFISELSFRTKTGTRLYLSPTLNTPRFFQVVPPGALVGATLATPGRVAEGDAFAALFRQRWREDPLDEAYGFYDAAAVAALALQAALVQTGAPPTVETLGGFVRPVAGPPGEVITWNTLDRGLELLRAGQDIDYQGLSGQLDFDAQGDPAKTLVQWSRREREGGIIEGPPIPTPGAAGGFCPEP
jgi:ABC-type branched-subunit amino acid transport system substrate-binding protein